MAANVGKETALKGIPRPRNDTVPPGFSRVYLVGIDRPDPIAERTLSNYFDGPVWTLCELLFQSFQSIPKF